MTWEDYESIVETLDILGDDEALDQLRASLRDLREGATIPWDEAQSQLDT